MPTALPILHFNDVYRVNPQKLTGGATIDVTQFACMLDMLRHGWPTRDDGKRDGLVLFSGDLFAPSVESSVTRGSHMVPVINELAPDVAVAGNHDFDFGYPHLTKLLTDTKFPWLLSNIIDETTGEIPEPLHEFYILERCGVHIGFIGLVESEWITTVPAWPSNFKYKDMVEVALDLSKRLRDPQGEHRCDLIVALTHSRIPNDVNLAKSIKALSPDHQPADFASTHGADLILGGHDHVYYASRGVTAWEGYDLNQEVLGAEEDQDVIVIKSGTDFRELSEVVLELDDAPEGSVRRKAIKSVKGKRHETKHGSPSSQQLREILSKVLDAVSGTMKNPVCKAAESLDLRSEIIRTQESGSGDWFADVIHHAYDDALCNISIESADGVFLCAGALRGDTVYGPGLITLGDILEILPFEDSIVVLEIDGETIWEAFEAGLATWPAQEGRFPVVAGFRVTWDSRKSPGQRVLNIAVQTHKRVDPHRGGDSTPNLLIEYDEIKRERGRKYVVVTREYMAQGHDGFECLKDQKMLINDEQGQMMSTIVRKYLLGSKYINKMNRIVEQSEKVERPKLALLHHDTERILRHTREAKERARNHWNQALIHVRSILHSPAHYRAPLSISRREHMGSTDCFDGDRMRVGKPQQRIEEQEDEDLPVIIPLADGRLKDVARA